MILVTLVGCYTPKNLPNRSNLDTDQYGSIIQVKSENLNTIEGELISVNANQLIVLNLESNKCVPIDIKNINSYKLWYAEPNHYGWTIPLYFLSTFTHGFGLILTAPINLITTISISVAGEHAYRYTHINLTYEELKKFARFPQGVPSTISLSQIKPKPIPKPKYNYDNY